MKKKETEVKLSSYLVTYKKPYIENGKKKLFTYKTTIIANNRIDAINKLSGCLDEFEVIECKRVSIPTNIKKKGNK